MATACPIRANWLPPQPPTQPANTCSPASAPTSTSSWWTPTDPQLPDGYIAEIELVALTLTSGQNVTTADFPFVPLISKTVDKANANAGDTLNFTVNLNYQGSDLLTELRVVDPVPAGISSVGSINMGGTSGPFVPQAAADGLDDQGAWSTGTALTASPDTLALGGGNITVSMVVNSSAGSPAITNITPTLAVDGGSATCGAPSPASDNLPANGGCEDLHLHLHADHHRRVHLHRLGYRHDH